MCREEEMTESKPVELLRDRQGVYGIGISDAYDIEALAWACGVDPTNLWRTLHMNNLILRPNMLQFGKQCHYRSFAVLQKITGGFRHGMFTNSREERLRQFIHHEALIRAGAAMATSGRGKYKILVEGQEAAGSQPANLPRPTAGITARHQ